MTRVTTPADNKRPVTKTATPLAPLVIPFEGLKERGVVGSRRQLARLLQAGRFPLPVYLSKKRPVWRVTDIEQYVCDLLPGKPLPLKNKKR